MRTLDHFPRDLCRQLVLGAAVILAFSFPAAAASVSFETVHHFELPEPNIPNSPIFRDIDGSLYGYAAGAMSMKPV